MIIAVDKACRVVKLQLIDFTGVVNHPMHIITCPKTAGLLCSSDVPSLIADQPVLGGAGDLEIHLRELPQGQVFGALAGPGLEGHLQLHTATKPPSWWLIYSWIAGRSWPEPVECFMRQPDDHRDRCQILHQQKHIPTTLAVDLQCKHPAMESTTTLGLAIIDTFYRHYAENK